MGSEEGERGIAFRVGGGGTLERKANAQIIHIQVLIYKNHVSYVS